MVKSKKLFKYYSLVIISLFILTRLSFLDRDLPPWELTLYSSFDEMLYNIPAFNLYEFGEMSHQVVPFLPDDSITHNNWLQNYITYISFKLFGNNYFGLRMPSVIASSIIICLLLYFLYNILNINNVTRLNQRFNLFFYIIISLYLIFNFSFLVASRVNEPTIFRMMTMIVIMYFALKMFPEDHDLKLTHVYFLGLLSCFGVLFVYLHNLFIIPAFGFFIIHLRYKKGIKETITGGFIFLIGILSAFAVFLFVFELVYDESYWETIKFFINHPKWGGRVNLLASTSTFQFIKSFIRNGYMFFTTNIFRFDMSLLFLLLALGPIYFIKVLREKSQIDILVFYLIFFLFLQSLFINDFPRRKLIILFPLVIIVISNTISYCSTFFNIINPYKKMKYIYISYISIVMVFLIYAVFRSQTNLILDRFDPLLYFIPFINIISIICAFLFLISYIFQKNYIFILLIFLITLFSGNFYLNSKYIFLDPSYVYKNTMNELSNIIGEGKVAGDFSMGIRLYNNANVFVNPYRHYYKNQTRYYEIMNSLVEKKQVDYTVSYLNRPDYEDQWQRDRYYKLMDLGFELIGKYPIQEVYGEIGLYKLK